MEEKPQFKDQVSQKLEALHQLWNELQTTTQEKAQHLSAAWNSYLRSQIHADLSKWISAMEDQLQSDPGKDLTSVNRMLAKLKACERVVDWECCDRGDLGEHIWNLKVSIPSVPLSWAGLYHTNMSPGS